MYVGYSYCEKITINKVYKINEFMYSFNIVI